MLLETETMVLYYYFRRFCHSQDDLSTQVKSSLQVRTVFLFTSAGAVGVTGKVTEVFRFA